jgi:RNA polymerase sigma-70 factor (ECF subfamily)
MTDEELLSGVSRGDEAAFLDLYQRHRDPVFRFAYRMLGSIEPAEDIAHDCFLSLISKPEKFDASRAPLRTYLYGTARNLAMQSLRRSGQDVAIDELQIEPAMPVPAQLDRMIDDEIAMKVQSAVSQLPPLQREALVFFEYEELSMAEIARIIGTDVGTIKGRLYRARQALKRMLTPLLSDAIPVTVLEEACK